MLPSGVWIGEWNSDDTGGDGAAKEFHDSVKALAAEEETFSWNIDKVSTAQGRLKDDKKMLTGHVADLTGQVAELTNEMDQKKSEINIKNASFTALEEANVASIEIIRFERLRVLSLQAQVEVGGNKLEALRVISKRPLTGFLRLKINGWTTVRQYGFWSWIRRSNKLYRIRRCVEFFRNQISCWRILCRYALRLSEI